MTKKQATAIEIIKTINSTMLDSLIWDKNYLAKLKRLLHIAEMILFDESLEHRQKYHCLTDEELKEIITFKEHD